MSTKLSDNPDVRWADRLVMDGTWAGNLFQFYFRVIQRLSADLKIPFQLDDDLFRRDDTPVHEAIREALVNALIHADHSGMGGVVIEKYRDRFELSNPGSLLVSMDELFNSNTSECRNKTLQTIFMMLGLGEKAGSGIDKIRRGWASQHWRLPRVSTRMLQSLVARGALVKQGDGRWSRYRLPRREQGMISLDNADSSLGYDKHSLGNKNHYQGIEPQLALLAEPARRSKRMEPAKMRAILLRLCEHRWLTRSTIAQLVNRNAEDLRNRYLNPMVAEGLLELRYPDKVNRTDQTYRTATTGDSQSDQP